MNKIINGKKYDTATATKVGIMSNKYTSSLEILYKKNTGEYFLLASGNCSILKEHAIETDMSSFNEGYIDIIYPLSEDAAKEWVSKVMDADAYEGLFGQVEE